MHTCGCGGTVKYRVVTTRKKRGRFLQVIHFTRGRCQSCKKNYTLAEREDAVRAKCQSFFL